MALVEQKEYKGDMGILAEIILLLDQDDEAIKFRHLAECLDRFRKQTTVAESLNQVSDLEPIESTHKYLTRLSHQNLTPAIPELDGISNSQGREGAKHGGRNLGNKAEMVLEDQESESESQEDGVPRAKKSPMKRAVMEKGGRNANSKKMRKSEDHEPEGEAKEVTPKLPVKGRDAGLITGNEKRKPRQQESESGPKRGGRLNTGAKKRKLRNPEPESESSEDDTQKAKKTPVKRRRVSSKSGAEAKGKGVEREQRGKLANEDPKWKTAQAPHPCIECIQRSIPCIIYVGKVSGRRRVVCVGCRTRKGGCSLNHERRKMQYVKVEETDDDDDKEQNESKAKGKLKGMVRASTQRASQRSPRAVTVKSEHADDPVWFLGKFNCKNAVPIFLRFLGEAGPSGGTANPEDTTKLWARFLKVESCVSTLQREVRGEFSEIRQELGRMKSDQEVDTQAILQKMLEMGIGAQEQLKSMRQQTKDISHAMGKVIDRVEKMHTQGADPVHASGFQEAAADVSNVVRPLRFTECAVENGHIRMKGVEDIPEVIPDTIVQTVLNFPADAGSTTMYPVSDMENSVGDTNSTTPIDLVRTPPPIVNVIQATPKASLDPPSSVHSPESLLSCQASGVSSPNTINAGGRTNPVSCSDDVVPETETEYQEATTHLTVAIRPSRKRSASPLPGQGAVTRSRSGSRAPQGPS
jgi:hypothetical protein